MIFKDFLWADNEGLIRTDEPTILHLLFKNISIKTIIGVSNFKKKIEKEKLTKFANNSKYILDYMH